MFFEDNDCTLGGGRIHSITLKGKIFILCEMFYNKLQILALADFLTKEKDLCRYLEFILQSNAKQLQTKCPVLYPFMEMQWSNQSYYVVTLKMNNPVRLWLKSAKVNCLIKSSVEVDKGTQQWQRDHQHNTPTEVKGDKVSTWRVNWRDINLFSVLYLLDKNVLNVAACCWQVTQQSK